jgi:hypothetical protein
MRTTVFVAADAKVLIAAGSSTATARSTYRHRIGKGAA